MQTTLGVDAVAYGDEQFDFVTWDSARVMNPHILLMGTSGAGKTHTLRRMISDMLDTAEHPVRFHVMDVHNDMVFEDESSVMFSEQTDFGINPLSIDPDPHEGGIRKRIQALLSALNRTSSRLGSQQEALLREMIEELYVRKGFYPDDPSSWTEGGLTPRGKPKTFPTLAEVHQFARIRKEQVESSASVDVISQYRAFRRSAKEFQTRLRQARRQSHDLPDASGIAEKRLELINAYSAWLSSVMDGEANDEIERILQYDGNAKILTSVMNRLSNLAATGVFSAEPPPFEPGSPIWRYKIKPLSEEEKQLFVRFRMEEIIRRTFALGETDQVREVVVLDEAHLFFDEDPLNPINRIAKEGRKFGLALICASQGPKHFSEDFLSLVGTKVVLKIDELHWNTLSRRLKVPEQALKSIVPRKSMVVQVKTNDFDDPTQGTYRFVLIPQARPAADAEMEEYMPETASGVGV